MRAGRCLTFVGDAPAQHIIDQPALGLMVQPGAVTLDHPVQRQRHRRAFQHHPGAIRVVRGLRDDQPAPLFGAWPHRGDRPPFRRRVQPRTPLPVAQQIRRPPTQRYGQRPVRQVLQHHRLIEDRRRSLDDAGRGRAFEAEFGEGLVHAPVEGHPFELVGDDQPMHGLGHLDEPHLAAQCHQRQVEFGGDGTEPGRQCHLADLHNHPENPRLGHAAQVPAG